MKFFKYCSSLLLLCAVLVSVRQTDAASIGNDGEKSSLAELTILASIPNVDLRGPIAKILVGSVLTISLASTKLSSKSTDFLESHKKLSDQLSGITQKMSEISTQLPEITENYAFFTKMQNDINKLQAAVSENMETVLNSKTTGTTTNLSLLTLLDYFSPLRQNLQSFVTKYITPKDKSTVFGDVKLFYDFILKKEQNAIERGDDCFDESIQTKLFKTYMFLLQTLSDAYAMVISAHTVQYQKELKANNDTEAAETQRISLELIDQYKSDMKALMEKTKWALATASRDVRNCGTFDSLKKGETFDRVSFAYILPKFKDWATQKSNTYSAQIISKNQCFIRQQEVKYRDFEIGSCSTENLKKPGAITVFIDTKNSEWPYVYLKNQPTFGGDTEYGNSTASIPGLMKRTFMNTNSCYSMFCEAYKNKTLGISTMPVSAEEGAVITGVRFRIRNNTICIDIREGILLDDLTVDPTSLLWIETIPTPDKTIYLSSHKKTFELGDITVQGNDYIKTIQFVVKNKAEGIFGLSVNGETFAPQQPMLKSNVINIARSEDPERFGVKAKNLVSKAPIPSEPYYISLQPSSFAKNLGATTVPYFDTRDVITIPAAPLTGIGMYHQTTKGSGGFISLKLKQAKLIRFVDYDWIQKILDAKIDA